MTSGDSGGNRRRVDRRGVTFRNELRTYVALDSLGVVELDTSVALLLPGRAQNSDHVLVPDTKAAPLVDMAGETFICMDRVHFCICMDRVHFCMGMFISGILPVCHLSVFRMVILCFISVCYWGGGRSFWPVVGRGGGGGFLRMVSLSGETLVN